jgi:hypothetical protein
MGNPRYHTRTVELPTQCDPVCRSWGVFEVPIVCTGFDPEVPLDGPGPRFGSELVGARGPTTSTAVRDAAAADAGAGHEWPTLR